MILLMNTRSSVDTRTKYFILLESSLFKMDRSIITKCAHRKFDQYISNYND